MTPTGSRALPRLFRKLVLGVALASSPQALAVAETTIVDDDETLTEVDRAIGIMLDSMVDRALAHRRDVSEVLSILLQNMHPFDATRSICDAALSPSADVRRVLCDALARNEQTVGRGSVLEHLMRDDDPQVRHAAVRAARR
jgi:hypothetical protein